jgi:glycosyltransferase involved in cell wall biosynthesis
MITYNQAKFIAQAVESALMQETDFDYEIVIGEDASSDGTREIVLDFQRRYPEKIRVLAHETNLGFLGKANFVKTIFSSRGEYIALLEGDDYWISPHKLQTQVDFLQSHPECVICFHPTAKVDTNGEFVGHVFDSSKGSDILSLEDIVKENFMATCSVMFRAGLVTRIPDWYFHPRCGDWTLYVLVAQNGSIGRVPSVMAAYRSHSQGLWSGMQKKQEKLATIEVYQLINSHLNFAYDRIIRHRVSKELSDVAVLEAAEGRWAQAIKAMWRSTVLSPFNKDVPKRKLLLHGLRRIIPKIGT